MSMELLAKIRRGLKKPPRYIVERLVQEAHGQAERHLASVFENWTIPEIA